MTLRIVSLLIVPLIFYSCTSHRTIEANNLNIQFHIKPGDKVRVQTKDNKETEFVVAEVTDEALIGENQKVMFDDIANLEEINSNVGSIFLYTTLGVLLAGLAVVNGASCVFGCSTWY